MEGEKWVTCPKCGFEQSDNPECMKCRIVFAKFDPLRSEPAAHNLAVEPAFNGRGTCPGEESIDGWISGTGRYALIGLMAFFFFYMVIKRSGWCFLDYVNLPFHEFGHILFRPFGETMQFLGGTLSQLMWPLILMMYFMLREEFISSSFCLFWFGENFLNISKYVADARTLGLPLVGGGIHDWNYLLHKWNMLSHDRIIAHAIFIIGVLLMTGSMIWAFLAKAKKRS